MSGSSMCKASLVPLNMLVLSISTMVWWFSLCKCIVMLHCSKHNRAANDWGTAPDGK